MTPLTQLVAVTDGVIDEKNLLGTVSMVRVPDHPVDVDDVRRAIVNAGFDESLAPKAPKQIDVFKNACRSVETRRGPAQGGGAKRHEVKVDEVLNNGDECVYQITRMVRDEANRLIDHPKAMRVVYAKVAGQSDPLAFEPLDQATYEQLADLVDRVRDYYTANLRNVPGARVRAVVRKVLGELRAIPYRGESGGVYFTAIEHHDTIAQLKGAIDTIYHDEADFDLLPVANSHALRQQLDKHHIRAIRDETTDMMVKIRERLSQDGKPRQDMVENLLEQRRALGAQRKRMAELVGRETDGVNEALNMLDDQLEELQDRAAGA